MPAAGDRRIVICCDRASLKPVVWLHDFVVERYQRGIHQPGNLRTLFESPITIERLATPIVRV